jgi:hypothetical protein
MRQSLFVLFLLVFTPAATAGPLRYLFDVTPSFWSGHPLHGLQFQVEMVWDPSALTPEITDTSNYSNAKWPSTNTEIKVTFSGVASLEGTYSAEPEGKWMFIDLRELSRYRFITPFIKVDLFNDRGDRFFMERFHVDFEHVGAFGPKEFDENEPIVIAGPLPRMPPYSGADWSAVRASAHAIPEPSVAALAVSALLSLAALRHRK